MASYSENRKRDINKYGDKMQTSWMLKYAVYIAMAGMHIGQIVCEDVHCWGQDSTMTRQACPVSEPQRTQ
jgi:hypothetical protein